MLWRLRVALKVSVPRLFYGSEWGIKLQLKCIAFKVNTIGWEYIGVQSVVSSQAAWVQIQLHHLLRSVTLGELFKPSRADAIVPSTNDILYLFSSVFFWFTEPSCPYRGQKYQLFFCLPLKLGIGLWSNPIQWDVKKVCQGYSGTGFPPIKYRIRISEIQNFLPWFPSREIKKFSSLFNPHLIGYYLYIKVS